MQRLGDRWDERYEGLELVIAQSSIEIDADAQAIWDFILAPESALLVIDGVVKTFRVPKTPIAQPGEQVCIVTEQQDRLHVDVKEIVALTPLESLVSRWRTGPRELVEKTTISADGHSRTSLTTQLAIRVELGSARQARPNLETHLDQMLRRLRAAVESGARLPKDDAPPKA